MVALAIYNIVVSFSANYNILFFNLSLVETNAYNFHMTKNSHGLTSESLFSPRKKQRNPAANAAMRPLVTARGGGTGGEVLPAALRFLPGPPTGQGVFSSHTCFDLGLHSSICSHLY
jgi:hypothetical protein